MLSKIMYVLIGFLASTIVGVLFVLLSVTVPFSASLGVLLSSIGLFGSILIFFIVNYASAYLVINLVRRKTDLFGNVAPLVSVVMVFICMFLLVLLQSGSPV